MDLAFNYAGDLVVGFDERKNAELPWWVTSYTRWRVSSLPENGLKIVVQDAELDNEELTTMEKIIKEATFIDFVWLPDLVSADMVEGVRTFVQEASSCVATGVKPFFKLPVFDASDGLVYFRSSEYEVQVLGVVQEFVFTGVLLFEDPVSNVRMKQCIVAGGACAAQERHPVHVGEFVYFATTADVNFAPLTGFVQSIDSSTHTVCIGQCYEGETDVGAYPFYIKACDVWPYYN
jgi:hypothetical protein